jgi:hypothetical protein
MVPAVDVLHDIDGRLRIRAPMIKQEPPTAAVLAEQIRAIIGVRDVTTNPVTGSIVITYRSDEMDRRRLLHELSGIVGVPSRFPAPAPASTVPDDLQRHVVNALAKSAVEAAIRRVVLALI